jgi:hypothetical protein
MCIATHSLPLDLHVLGLPPAFTLSQDQTLQLNLNKFSSTADRPSTLAVLITNVLT